MGHKCQKKDFIKSGAPGAEKSKSMPDLSCY